MKVSVCSSVHIEGIGIVGNKGFLKSFKPDKMIDSLKKRGLGGSYYHAARRLGTMRESAMAGPELIRINPMGFVCNHKCPMCWLQHLDQDYLKEQKRKETESGMKLQDYVGLFDSMTAGLHMVNLVGGGEPLAHRDAREIMSAVKQRGWFGFLISNGTLMKEEIASAMVDMDWDLARISVHAGDRKTYEEIQGVDRFDIMKENLTRYDRIRREKKKEKKCELAIFHVIQHENINSIEKLFEIAENVGADFIEFDPIIPYDTMKVLTAEELHHARESIVSCAASSAIPCNVDEIVPQLQVQENNALENKKFVPAKRCSVGFDQSFITAHGDVLPCCFSDEVMGNVRDTSFKEIWFGEKYSNFRKRLIQGKFAKYCITNRCTLPNVLHN